MIIMHQIKTKKSKYARAGVDFEKEHDIVGILKALNKVTLPFTEDLRKIGISFPEFSTDFSGGFRVDVKKLLENRISRYIAQECVDGPGSKPVVHALYNGDNPIKLACASIDSIAMVVNDLICSGARPVTLTEYHSWHNPNLEIARQMAYGNLIAAELSKATIIGGENASLSIMITGPVPEKAYDMCHIAHGIILDKELVDNPLGKQRVKDGDIVIGLSSSGIHCNGITLAWKTAIDYSNKGFLQAQRINEKNDFLGESVAEAILTPTTIYVGPVLKLINEYKNSIKAIANITGEGIDNIRRVLPKNIGLGLDYSNKHVQKPQPIFRWIEKNADVPVKEMYLDYNMGTGMVLVVDSHYSDEIIGFLNKYPRNEKYPWQNFKAYKLGEVAKDKKQSVNLIAYNGKKEYYKKPKNKE